MRRKSESDAMVGAIEAFRSVSDPRIERRKLHPLVNVLVMALCGAIAGANGWDELALFARTQLDWFRTFLDAPNGAPSADTFRRVFEVLDAEEFESALRAWVGSVSEALRGEVVAIDGKSLKAATQHAGSTTPLHLLHAWAVEQRLLLGMQRVEGAPGEAPAIPEMLKRLSIEGAIVTTDANGCTKKVTAAVRAAKADYVLALKGNRGPLHKRAIALFEEAESRDFRGARTHRTRGKEHGREEERVVRVLGIADAPPDWCDLKSIAMIERTRTVGAKTSVERAYYISSLEPAVKKIAHAIRAHWEIENGLHWLLDVAFDEDSRRIRDQRAGENYALLSRLALMMLKRSPERLSIVHKRKRAGWDLDFLTRILAGGI